MLLTAHVTLCRQEKGEHWCVIVLRTFSGLLALVPEDTLSDPVSSCRRWTMAWRPLPETDIIIFTLESFRLLLIQFIHDPVLIFYFLFLILLCFFEVQYTSETKSLGNCPTAR